MMSDRTRHPMHRGDEDRAEAEMLSCGAKTRGGSPCRNLPMRNGRCRMHGGASTGAKTLDGLARIRAAATIHGNRTAAAREFRSLIRTLRADARRVCEMV